MVRLSMTERVSSSYPNTTVWLERTCEVVFGGVGASSVVRKGASRSGTTMKIMITPDIMIWIARNIVRLLTNGGRSVYPTVVIDSTTNSRAWDQDIVLFSRTG